jgi:hypothetical protein
VAAAAFAPTAGAAFHGRMALQLVDGEAGMGR